MCGSVSVWEMLVQLQGGGLELFFSSLLNSCDSLSALQWRHLQDE